MTKNVALKAGLIYSINSQLNITIDGGLIQENGFPNTGVDSIDAAIQRASFNIDKVFVDVMKSMKDEINNLIWIKYEVELAQNFQFQLIKSTIGFINDVSVDNQDSFLRASSASLVSMNGLRYQGTITHGPLIIAD